MSQCYWLSWQDSAQRMYGFDNVILMYLQFIPHSFFQHIMIFFLFPFGWNPFFLSFLAFNVAIYLSNKTKPQIHLLVQFTTTYVSRSMRLFLSCQHFSDLQLNQGRDWATHLNYNPDHIAFYGCFYFLNNLWILTVSTRMSLYFEEKGGCSLGMLQDFCN